MFTVFDIETILNRELYQDWLEKNPDKFPPPYMHIIVCLGFAQLNDDYSLESLGAQVDTKTEPKHLGEKKLLQHFSDIAQHTTSVTFNGRGFDMPVIVYRCLHHNIPLQWYYSHGKYRERFWDAEPFCDHLDVMDFLTDYGVSSRPSLHNIAKLVGLPGKTGINGSQVEQLYNDGKYTQIKEYCTMDVLQTLFLFLKVQILRGRIPADKLNQYESAIKSTLKTKMGFSVDW
jgi:hypothetical protein